MQAVKLRNKEKMQLKNMLCLTNECDHSDGDFLCNERSADYWDKKYSYIINDTETKNTFIINN